jgi:hypothetical protein
MSEYEGFTDSFNYHGSSIIEASSDFASLPELTKKQLELPLARVAASAFRRPLSKAFREDVASHIRGGDLLISLGNDGFPEGFSIFQSFPELDAAYLAGVVKKPTAPSRVMEKIVNYYMRTRDISAITVRTQNDRVAQIISNACGVVFALDGPAHPREVDLLNKMGLVPTNLPFDDMYLIVKGYYGEPMIMGEERRRLPIPRIEEISKRLDYQAGDAMLLVGYRK